MHLCFGKQTRARQDPATSGFTLSQLINNSMKSSAIFLAALASLSSLSVAQSNVTVPEGFENTFTGNTGFLWRSVAFQYQCVYDTQHFVNQNIDHPIEITRLRFRPLNGTIDPGGQIYTGVTIQLSTATLDSANMDINFATNVGADVATVFNGDVTLLPVTGATPNDHHIDILLQTPFLYNPLNGPLLVDVLAPTAPSAAVPNMAASNDHLVHFARRNSTANVGSLTGGLSGFAAAMKIDYNLPAGLATRSTYGNSCYDRNRMLYEQFTGGSVPDLINTNWTLIYQPSALGGSYVVLPGANPYVAPGATAVDLLTMTPTSASSGVGNWDDGSIVMTPAALATGFPYPSAASATTTDITINSNGRVLLGNTIDNTFATNGANYGSRSAFSGATGSGLPIIAGFDVDLDPTVGGNIWYEDPSPNGGVRITWDNITNWQDPTGPLAGANFIQIELIPGGQINIAYGANLATGGSNSNDGLVGFSAGGNEPETNMVDWSSLAGYLSGDGTSAITLVSDARPILGTTINLVTDNVPPGSFGAFNLVSLGSLPGIDLGAIGAPGCEANVDINTAVTAFVAGVPISSRALSLPVNPSLSGINLFSQSVVLGIGVNALGVMTSNGAALLTGTL
jgi:hypothetical protein